MTKNSDPIRSGDRWVFPDGRTLPVIAGGSDDGVAAEAPAEAPAEAAPVAEAPAADDPFDAELGDDAVFPRGYVEKLRKQGQTYREQMQEKAEQLEQYENVYGQYENEDRRTWFQMAQEWARDPRAGAEMMQRIADAVLDDGVTPEEATEQVIAEDQVAAEAEQAGVNLTPEQIQQMIDERVAAQDFERQQEQAIEQIFSEIKAAGFEPRSRDGQAILWTANNETDGDIAKAIEAHKADRQKVIDDYVAGKSAPTSRPAPSDGVLASQAPAIDTLDDAFKAANAYIDGLSRQPG